MLNGGIASHEDEVHDHTGGDGFCGVRQHLRSLVLGLCEV